MSKVKCLYCGNYFDWEKESHQKIGRRYAHQQCVLDRDESLVEEDKAKNELFQYLSSLNYNYNYIAVNATLNKYISDYGYTYRGMLDALKWFYDIKKNRIDTDRGIVGIIPHIYQNAQDYYNIQREAITINEEINISDFIGKKVEINITPPVPKLKKKKLFNME